MQNQTDYACRSFWIVLSDPSSLLGISTVVAGRFAGGLQMWMPHSCEAPQRRTAVDVAYSRRHPSLHNFLSPCTIVTRRFFVGILDLIFPKRCVNCGRLGQYICATCRRSVRSIAINESICPVCERPAIDGATHPRCKSRYSLDGLTSFFHYSGPIRHAVKSLKYRHVSDLASEFVSLIPEALLSQIHDVLGEQNVIVLPVPLHFTRLRARGYNQADVLGRILAQRLHLPMHTDILYRTRATSPQVETKSRNARLRNMDKAFACTDRDIKGVSVVLFDDVFTTGATMRSAANVLKRHGAKFVWAITMAR